MPGLTSPLALTWWAGLLASWPRMASKGSPLRALKTDGLLAAALLGAGALGLAVPELRSVFSRVICTGCGIRQLLLSK